MADNSMKSTGSTGGIGGNPYLDGRLNIGPAAQVPAVHGKPEGGEKAKVIRGNDLRNGKK